MECGCCCCPSDRCCCCCSWCFVVTKPWHSVLLLPRIRGGCSRISLFRNERKPKIKIAVQDPMLIDTLFSGPRFHDPKLFTDGNQAKFTHGGRTNRCGCSLLLLQLFSQNKPNRTTITHSSPLPPPPPTSRGSNRPLIRYEERCVVWHLPQIPLINNSLPPTHFSKQTHNQDSFSLSLQKQRKETQSSDAASCCFSPSFSYLGLSLKILTHPATMKEAFGFRGQTIYLLRAQGFKNRQTA